MSSSLILELKVKVIILPDHYNEHNIVLLNKELIEIQKVLTQLRENVYYKAVLLSDRKENGYHLGYKLLND